MVAKKSVKKINLALQGGGAHGAFTWGVLDRILEDEHIDIEAISGTSAGAINGACVAYGTAVGGKAGGRKVLDEFWKRVSDISKFSPVQPTLYDKLYGHNMDYSPSFVAADYISRILSPYQTNLFDINPMRDILISLIDFNRISANNPIKLYVNATNVLRGKIRIFEPEEITIDSVMASACLPNIYKTVEIDGEHYWDGGYSGNPALFPLFYNCACQDILIVQINPIRIEEVPITANEILDRINEISFNSSLMDEMRAISFVNKLLSKGKIRHDEYKHVKIHMIDAGPITNGLGSSSKLNLDWDFISHLKESGRRYADDWLKINFDDIGKKSTIDITEKFL